jgi:hypothetical protein
MDELRTITKRLSKKALEELINKTVHFTITPGYMARCYCSRCGASWEMRSSGIKRFQETKALKPPKGINDLNKEEMKKCFFIIEPCFACRTNGEKIKTEVRLIPQLKK